MSRDKSEVDQEVEIELRRILNSALFSKAHRSSKLLHYLVTRSQDTAQRSSELAVGVEVFGRDPAQYSPGDDPIVRVQIGRLRHKLIAYYAGEGQANPVRISIPVGSHNVLVEHPDRLPPSASARIAFRPLICLSREQDARILTMGISEELTYHLYRQFGHGMTSGRSPHTWPKTLHEVTVNYLFEGSMRKDGNRVRISLRLLDLLQDSVAWSEQLDHEFDVSINSQEKIATACSEALRRHMALP